MPEPGDPDLILSRLEALGIRLGLDRLRAVLATLGDPQRRFPSVLIGGSNGKGSTSALLAAMAGAAGYRVGHYTSPHLETVEERVRIGGRAIDRGRLAALLERVVATAEADGGELPTYFEALTGVAFLAFAEAPVDLAVLEVGMGGRLDATNLADPLLSVVTSISLEHREHLGDTLAAIAREKAGILRSGRPALAWVEALEARAALLAVATEAGGELVFADREAVIATVERIGWVGQVVRLGTTRATYDLCLALLGEHQVRNLALAVLAAERLADLGFPDLNSAAIGAGAAACRWPGRLEAVELPGGRRALLDAAHNPEGIAALATFLDHLGEPFDLLFGVLGEKDVQDMLPPLATRATKVFLTQPTSPRARSAGELASLLEARNQVLAESDPARALNAAIGTNDGRLLVTCGSIVLVGEVRELLRLRFGLPPPAAQVLTSPC